MPHMLYAQSRKLGANDKLNIGVVGVEGKGKSDTDLCASENIIALCDDMTIKWFYHLNRFHVPARGMTVDMVVNVGLLLLLGANNFVILYISNIGYVFCHVLALSGFLLLRRDRPQWPRPIKMGSAWLPIAGLLALFNLVLVLEGIFDQDLAAYIGFYAHSPGAGQDPDRLLVWVADAETCRPPALFSGTRRI